MYVSMPYYRVQQAEYTIRVLVAVAQEHINTYSTCRLLNLKGAPCAQVTFVRASYTQIDEIHRQSG